MEGNRSITDALEAGARIEELFVADDMDTDPIVGLARERGAYIHVAGWQVVKAVSDSVTPQGMVAVLASPLAELGSVTLDAGLVVVLAGVGDPGNVGTLIRTAAAAGADAVILTEGSADPLNPKTARASAAALFATTIVADVSLDDAVEHVRSLGAVVLGAAGDSARSIYDADLTRPVALVLGNESWGLDAAQEHLLDDTVSIPMPGSVESLNVATAGSIVMFEALRQRRPSDVPTVSSGSREAEVE